MMRSILLRMARALAGGVAVALALAPGSGPAQTVVPLLDYTNVWRFHDTGTDPGTDWMAPGFDDSAWPAGPGPLGVEPSVPYPYPLRISTPLALGTPSTTAHFFRTHFWFDPTNVAPAQRLEADLFVDDGGVVFLNGVEVVRMRVPVGETFSTFANGFNQYEGENELVALEATALLPGDNVLGVAVHQIANVSTDVYLGMRLRAVAPEPLVITRQPEDLTVEAGSNVTFLAAVSGGPAAFQWLTNGLPVTGATNSTYAFAASPSRTGIYSVVVSNALGAVESRGATLAVTPAPPDLSGPRMLSAIAEDPRVPYQKIFVFFNERLLNSSKATNNFRITPVGATNIIPVFVTIYNPSPPVWILLAVPSGLLVWGGDYVITVNGVRDSSPLENIIAPDSQIPLRFPATDVLVSATQTWRFHATLLDDPAIALAEWWTTNYVENAWWQSGVPPFYAGSPGPPCDGALNTLIPFQRHPTLLRTTFVWPPGRGATARLSFGYAVDRAVVFYLNGVEQVRTGLPFAPAPLDVNTRATGFATRCQTNDVTVTNLLPGTNWLAAAVYQERQPYMGTIETNLLFDFRLAERFETGPSLPVAEPPVLAVLPLADGRFRLGWNGPGFALESATHVGPGPNGKPGPWIEVPNMANPYTNAPLGDLRLFRLRR